MSKSFVSTADIVSMVVDAHAEDIKNDYELRPELKEVLLEYCGAIDSISDMYDGLSVNSKIEKNNCVTLSVELPDVVIDRQVSYIYELIERAVEFSIKKGEDSVFLNFTFPSLWKKANKQVE